jgi:hypothetical protein
MRKVYKDAVDEIQREAEDRRVGEDLVAEHGAPEQPAEAAPLKAPADLPAVETLTSESDFSRFMRPLPSTLGTILPAIDSVSEPVIGILAGLKGGFAGRDILSEARFASMESDDQRPRQHGEIYLADLAITLPVLGSMPASFRKLSACSLVRRFSRPMRIISASFFQST